MAGIFKEPQFGGILLKREPPTLQQQWENNFQLQYASKKMPVRKDYRQRKCLCPWKALFMKYRCINGEIQTRQDPNGEDMKVSVKGSNFKTEGKKRVLGGAFPTMYGEKLNQMKRR